MLRRKISILTYICRNILKKQKKAKLILAQFVWDNFKKRATWSSSKSVHIFTMKIVSRIGSVRKREPVHCVGKECYLLLSG